MFKITSKQPISWDWASFSLAQGVNEFPSRVSVPAELWPKLERFRELEVLSFEGDATTKDEVTLAELTERHLFDMSTEELSDLAKANGGNLPKEAGKLELIEWLKAKLTNPLESAKPAPAKPAEAAFAGPVTVE